MSIGKEKHTARPCDGPSVTQPAYALDLWGREAGWSWLRRPARLIPFRSRAPIGSKALTRLVLG